MHVSLYVSNLEKSIAFYNRFFNSYPTKTKHDYAKYELTEPGLIISFIENPDRVQSNFGHLGIQVETKEEVQEKMSIAKANDLSVIEEIGVACCYAVQDKFWAKDPDGIQWEIYYFDSNIEFNDPKYAEEDAVACCSPTTTKKKVKLSELSAQKCDPSTGCC